MTRVITDLPYRESGEVYRTINSEEIVQSVHLHTSAIQALFVSQNLLHKGACYVCTDVCTIFKC